MSGDKGTMLTTKHLFCSKHEFSGDSESKATPVNTLLCFIISSQNVFCFLFFLDF